MHLYQINQMILRFPRLCAIVSQSELEPIYSYRTPLYLSMLLTHIPAPEITTDDADIFAGNLKTKIQ
jgi:hypothetical protein